jgi:hypothetical protein
LDLCEYFIELVSEDALRDEHSAASQAYQWKVYQWMDDNHDSKKYDKPQIRQPISLITLYPSTNNNNQYTWYGDFCDSSKDSIKKLNFF